MEKQLVILGAGGHGKVIADIAKMSGYTDIIFLDDNRDKKECAGYPICGPLKAVSEYRHRDMVVAIGNCNARREIQTRLEEHNIKLATLIHRNAVVADDAVIGAGTVVMAGAIINPATVIGKGCIINTASSVDHDNRIGDFVHISVGTHLAGTVSIGDCSFVGAGAVVIPNINICRDCTIGAGAVVIRNATEGGVYVGVPAKRLPK